MTQTVKIGGLDIHGELVGRHVHATVRGHGKPGSRPLLGTLCLTREEWEDLRHAGAELEFMPTLRERLAAAKLGAEQ